MPSHSGYNHYFSQIRSKGDYPEKYTYTLIDTIEGFREVLDRFNESTDLALDTETTGLDHTREIVVGFSFAFNFDEGFYIPVRHTSGNIHDIKLVFRLLSDFLRGKRVFFYNKRFDLRMLQNEDVDIKGFTHFDVAVLTWLTDTNVAMPSLKDSERRFLGWEAPTFEDLTEGAGVQYIKPVDATQYAATDALGTYHLMKKVPKLIPKCSFIARLDNKALDVIKEIEETPILVDVEYLRKMAPSVSKSINEARLELFEIAGRTFHPDSPEQVGVVLVENGCAPAKKTPTGRVSTNAKDLAHIKHPLVDALLLYRKYQNLQSSYIDKLITEATRKKNCINVNHLPFKVPTGRYATGSDKKNGFFSKVNIQSIVKPQSAMFSVIRSDEEGSILGWKFTELEEGETADNMIEGLSGNLNIRKAFIPPEGFTWVSIDYSAQELRLPANFSKEPVFLRAFERGEDIHKNVAIEVLGLPYDKAKRGVAKVLNFGLMFLGNEWTIMNKLGCTREVAQAYKEKYESSHKTLYLWKSAVIQRGMRTGTVSTYYGRPRRLRHWFSSKDYRQVAFAKRSAVNSTVQGTGADVLRIGMCRILDKLYAPQNVDVRKLPDNYDEIDLLFHPLVHDEINYLVRTTKINELTPQLMELMTVQEKDWPVPMTVEVEFGNSWGHCFSFVWDGENYNPKFEE